MADSDGKGEAGGVEGPDAMYVKLIASDGHEFYIKREHALTSGTIKAMLSGPGAFVCLACQHRIVHELLCEPKLMCMY